MINKVKVTGQAMNRTALGIAHAYHRMYPLATLEDLNKAFPKEQLNGWTGKEEVKLLLKDKMFADVKDAAKFNPNKWDESFEFFYFEKPEETLKLKDGTEVAFFEKWDKDSFSKIVEQAKQYGIEVVKFEKDEGIGKKGWFELECLGGYNFPTEHIPAQPQEKKKKSWCWLWILLALLILGILLFFLLCKKNEPVVEKIVEKEIIIRDTVYLQEFQEFGKNFNTTQFVSGKADLSEDTKFMLHDLAKLLKSNPNLKLQIVGHTSKEGSEVFNQKLSEARAKAAFDFLVKERGIDASRLEYKGVGSSQPLDETKLEVNRRTEFIVIND